MTWGWYRALAPLVAVAAVWPAQAQQNPNCARLEAQLSAFDRSAADPTRAEQIRRYEEAAANQQHEIDRQEATARRFGCQDNNFFVLFSRQPPQCGPINAKIQQMRANLEQIHSNLARLQSDRGPERDAQRRAILVALAQQNCGPQYRAAVASTQPREGFFESLFGPGSILSRTPGWSSSGDTYRTVCVRTCDGYYYPVSFATAPSRFEEDEKVCQRTCPAAEVMLFTYRNPGEDIGQAVSISGQLYSTLPNAFRYRQSFDPNCSCRQPGETWAHALRNIDDNSVERGDIVVNEERARLMSKPRVDASGKPIKQELRLGKPNTKPADSVASSPANGEKSSAEAPADAAAVKPDPSRTVRSVGPTFLPAR